MSCRRLRGAADRRDDRAADAVDRRGSGAVDPDPDGIGVRGACDPGAHAAGSADRRIRTALLSAGVAAAVTTGVLRQPVGRLPGGSARWTRTNHRGGAVTLTEGPAWVAGALAGLLAAPTGSPLACRARAAAMVATLAGGGLGLLDDLAGDSGSRGLRGHLGALAHGRVTTGAIKVAGLAIAGVTAAAMARPPAARRRPMVDGMDALLGGAVVAGTANLVNLLDLRPGRALKVALLLAGPALARRDPADHVPTGRVRAEGRSNRGRRRGTTGRAVPLYAAAVGASLAALPSDLGERTMLGDTGANAAGALLGTAFISRAGRPAQLAALVVLAGLTGASERISFTRVIEDTPALAALDRLGRRAATGS